MDPAGTLVQKLITAEAVAEAAKESIAAATG